MLTGRFDEFKDGVLYGWAADPARPGARARIRVLDGATEIASGVADRPRADLAAGGLGDGRHAFEIRVPAGHAAAEVAVVAELDGAQAELPRPQAGERHIERLFDRYMEGLEARLSAMAADRAGLREATARLAAAEAEVADISRRLDEMEVFLLRIDGQLRILSERLPARRSGGVLGLFGARGRG